MSRKQKSPGESYVSMTELVLPNDTNTLNNLMGGRLMHWMDVVSAIAGQKHCNSIVVTASVDNISFRSPIALGNVVTLKAKATRAFSSSVEIRIDVEAENIPEGKKVASNSAYFIIRDAFGHFTEIDQPCRLLLPGRQIKHRLAPHHNGIQRSPERCNDLREQLLFIITQRFPRLL